MVTCQNLHILMKVSKFLYIIIQTITRRAYGFIIYDSFAKEEALHVSKNA